MIAPDLWRALRDAEREVDKALGGPKRRPYVDAVPGSMSKERALTRAIATRRGPVQRWRAPDGSLHRKRKAAGPGATLVTLPREVY